MQIIYRTGDFIAGPEPVILHGCNAQGVMGRGVSLAVRERLPFAYRAYRETYLERGLHLGEVVWAINIAHGSPPRIVGNAITQEFYGREPRRYVDYAAMRSVMQKVDGFVAGAQNNIEIANLDTKAVAMPMLGAGLGGGVWSEIASIIEQESQHFQPVVYQLPVP